jgi:hypothetical protein
MMTILSVVVYASAWDGADCMVLAFVFAIAVPSAQRSFASTHFSKKRKNWAGLLTVLLSLGIIRAAAAQ